jgi:methyltransferase (TIGR00027 family)
MSSRLAAAATYLPLQGAMLPLGIAATAAAGVSQVLTSRRLGVSQTAVEVLKARCAMHAFGMREDTAAMKLARVLPNASLTGLGLALFPLWLKRAIDGRDFVYPRDVEAGRETPVDLVVSRTRLFDTLIADYSADVRQIVVLGAGFDTRAYGPQRRGDIDVFEVDQAATQHLKTRALDEAGIDRDGVTFVTVDFSRDDLFRCLAQAGFDSEKPAIFLWEGVTLYLTQEQVRGTLEAVAAKTVSGSVVLADFYAERLLRPLRYGPAGRVLALTGETFRFGLPFLDPPAELETLAESTGFDVGDLRLLGARRRRGAFAAVAALTPCSEEQPGHA